MTMGRSSASSTTAALLLTAPSSSARGVQTGGGDRNVGIFNPKPLCRICPVNKDDDFSHSDSTAAAGGAGDFGLMTWLDEVKTTDGKCEPDPDAGETCKAADCKAEGKIRFKIMKKTDDECESNKDCTAGTHVCYEGKCVQVLGFTPEECESWHGAGNTDCTTPDHLYGTTDGYPQWEPSGVPGLENGSSYPSNVPFTLTCPCPSSDGCEKIYTATGVAIGDEDAPEVKATLTLVCEGCDH